MVVVIAPASVALVDVADDDRPVSSGSVVG